MKTIPLLGCFAAVLTALTSGCASRAPQLQRQVGESVVLIREEPATLAWQPKAGTSLRVRSMYTPGTNCVEYTEGTDYIVDYAAGTLRRTSSSRLPDFSENILFGQEEFDHSKFPGFGNGKFFAYIDYTLTAPVTWPVQSAQIQHLPATAHKLRTGAQVKIVAFGDSITAGGDATALNLIFWKRWADELGRKYPKAKVTAVNGATGGDSTVQGLERLKTKVIDEKPDLVLVGFGMNDHNVPPFGVALPQFEHNLRQIITRIRQETSAEIVLFSAFPPNPKWKFESHRMHDYADATARVAAETTCAYADVFSNWQLLSARKKPEDLLGNNINHPNDFGHWIYYRVLTAMGL